LHQERPNRGHVANDEKGQERTCLAYSITGLGRLEWLSRAMAPHI
jgi:hypothetical protein